MHAVVDISRAVHVVPIETGNLEGGVHVQALGANVGVTSFTARAAAGGAGVVGFRAVLPPIYGRIIRISVWPGAAPPTATPTLKITSPLGPLWTFTAIPIAGNAALTIGRDMAVYGPPLIEITDFGAANEEVVVALFVVADHEADPELDATVAAIAALTAGGMLAITGAGTGAAVRTLTSTSTGLVITDGSGSVGNPSFALDAEIQALTALVSAADKVPYYTGLGTAALADFTAAGRAILDDATAAAQATTLGLGTADSPQFAGVNIGHATDTTITRTGAGDVAVEGNAIYRAGGTDVPLTDGGTGASDAATARTNLGLGTIATQAANNVSISGGSVTGITDLAVADGGTGASTAAAARTNLGLDEAAITFVVDGGGSVITTGLKAFVEVPYTCTVVGWTILANVSGSIVVDVWKDTYANFPPTVADTIAGSEKPTLSTAQKNQDLTLTTWTTALTKGDILAFNVDSATTVTRVVVAIRVTR